MKNFILSEKYEILYEEKQFEYQKDLKYFAYIQTFLVVLLPLKDKVQMLKIQEIMVEELVDPL